MDKFKPALPVPQGVQNGQVEGRKESFPRQTLLGHEDLVRLGISACSECGAGSSFGELCLFESGEDGAITTHEVWCRDCEAGTSGQTLDEALRNWRKRHGDDPIS